MRKRNDRLCQISWPARVLSRHIVLILTKNEMLLYVTVDIEHQCLQIRTHISHKITKQVNALESSRAKSFDLGDITNVKKFG